MFTTGQAQLLVGLASELAVIVCERVGDVKEKGGR